MPEIEIRPPHEWRDFVECEDLQRDAWQMSDETEIVPAHLLITAHKNGGLVLGAYEGAQLVGFVFGFLGAERTGAEFRIKHCSHQLGVRRAFRSRGIGLALKQRQREYLLRQNLDLATWTYDPLQAVNANLNIARLGAIARRYIRDAYGELQDALNIGVASDRFEVEWWLNSERVQARIDAQEPAHPNPERQPIYEIKFDDAGMAHIAREADLEEGLCLVEIPADFNGIKARDLALGRAWREQTRVTFERAFAQGYSAVEFNNWRDDLGRRRSGYILQKEAILPS